MTTTSTTTGTIPKRRLDQERTVTAVAAMRAIAIDGAPIARVAVAYAMSRDDLAALLADLAHDVRQLTAEVQP